MVVIYLAKQGRLDWLQLVEPQPVYIGCACASEVKFISNPKGVRQDFDWNAMDEQGCLAKVQMTDDEFEVYTSILHAAPKLGEEREALALAHGRGWRFITADKGALDYAGSAMPDTSAEHFVDWLEDQVQAGRLDKKEVAAFIHAAMPGLRRRRK